jgi:hypothetical protein
MTTEPITLPLEQIVIDPALQPRVDGIDPDHVRMLETVPESWTPLVAVMADGQYVLTDGFHRYASAQNLGLEVVTVDVVAMPSNGDLKALAFSLNAKHGRPLSLTDRRAEAGRLLLAHPEVSNLEVSRRVGLSPTTVAAIRTRLEEADAIAPLPERIGADGTRYPVTTTRSLRHPGTLPDEGIGERLTATVGGLFTSEERRRQRKLAVYFRRLVVAVEDGDDLAGWDTAENAAEACRLVLGHDAAADLGERLGRRCRNVLNVAIVLGYVDDQGET